MKRVMFHLLVICILFPAGAAAIETSGPHGFTAEQCLSCHVSVPSSEMKGPLSLKSPVRSLCKTCHKRLMRAFSHPVEFVPEDIALPAEFPLTSDGKFTCSTCHDIHSAARGPSGEKTYFLRRKTGKGDFCIRCHGSKALSHATLLSAHMKRGGMSSIANAAVDDVSAECLSCHDGLLAKEVQAPVRTSPSVFFCPRSEFSHPIGVDYKSALRSKGNLRAEKNLNKSIRLYNGKVGCGSCHDPYKKGKGMLVISLARLCVECHLVKMNKSV